MFKENPTQGYQYKVVRGDRLDIIEQRAYGSVKNIIETSNPFLSKRSISLEGRPTIRPNDILIIPELQEFKDSKNYKIGKKNKNDVTVIIDDIEIKYTNVRIFSSIETVANGFTANFPWEYGKDKKIDKLLTPYNYPKTQIFIGEKLILTGHVYRINLSDDNNSSQANIEGFSYSADAIDSTVPAPFEENNITLEQRAQKMLSGIGIKCEFEFDPGGPFDKVTADRNDTIFSHLQSLASQRGGLLTSLPNGNMVFTKAKNSKPVGEITLGDGILKEINSDYDGRKMFGQITAYGQSPGSPSKNATITDDRIPKSRFFSFAADETTDGNIENAAIWKRSQIYASSIENTLNVIGLYAPNGNLWKPNTQVTVISPVLFSKKGYTYLIKSVEYIIESKSIESILSVISPSVYTGEKIILPWEEN